MKPSNTLTIQDTLEELTDTVPVYDAETAQEEWKIKSLALKTDAVVISADTGKDVTVCLCEIASSLCLGKTIFDRYECTESDGVLYICGTETSKAGIEKIIRGLNKDEVTGIKILSLGESGFSLADPQARNGITSFLEKNPKYRTVIIDNTGDAFDPIKGGSGKGVKLISETSRWMGDLKRIGMLQILVTPENKGFLKNSTMADLKIQLTQIKNRNNPTLKVDFLYARHLSEQESFMVDLIENKEGKITVTVRSAIEDQKIWAAFLLSEGYTQVEAAKEIGVNQGTVSRWQDKLLADGLINKKGHVIMFTDKGSELHKKMKFKPKDA